MAGAVVVAILGARQADRQPHLRQVHLEWDEHCYAADEKTFFFARIINRVDSMVGWRWQRTKGARESN